MQRVHGVVLHQKDLKVQVLSAAIVHEAIILLTT